MILLVNTAIAPNRGSLYQYNRGLLPSFSNYDIFRYTLNSYSVLPFSQVLLFLQLDPEYQQYKDQLEQECKDLFGDSLQLFWYRNIYQHQWQETLDFMHDDEPIWLLCNHDHPFLDSSLDCIAKTLDDLQKIQGPGCAVFSHWSESINVVAQKGGTELSGSYVVDMPGYENADAPIPSIQIMNPELFYSVWFNYDYGSSKLPRLDSAPGADWINAKYPEYQLLVPYRELCRHFDGYGHHNAYLPNSEVPALAIPPGFFEKDIKIRLGYEKNLSGWVNLNPEKSYAAVDTDGTFDYYSLSDIPLFWRPYITEIDVNGEKLAYWRENDNINHRNIKILDNALSAVKRFSTPYCDLTRIKEAYGI